MITKKLTAVTAIYVVEYCRLSARFILMFRGECIKAV